jgi:tetrapyrrole methylase family protein/MazG family protein
MEKCMSQGITIVGLGPGGRQHWTLAAYNLLTQADEIYVRTSRHPGVADIAVKIFSFDEIDGHPHTAGDLVDQIAAEIIRLGQREAGVIYGVPGHPNVGEATVTRICELAKIRQIPVTMIPGLSFIEPTLTALKLAACPHLQIADAIEIAPLHHPPLEPDRPALITQLHAQALAAQIKQTLLNAYADHFVVTLVQAAGTEAERVWSCPLAELDHQPDLDQLTTLYLPADPDTGSFSAFQETIAHLRAPDGCPWDREQTHQSLRPYLLEETYEVLEALDANDTAALAEELGDLLLQVVLHTQVAIDLGEFKMGQVIDHINRKLQRRHPHVFGDVRVDGVEEVMLNWEAIKQLEKATHNGSQSDDQPGPLPSILDGIPEALPALLQALAISKRAARAGFEWPNIEGVLDKLIEEAREIAEAADQEQLEAEIGDLLFSAVNLARWRKVDPESALRAMNARFTRRFKKLEALAAAQGKALPQMSIAEMDALWEEAKRFEA